MESDSAEMCVWRESVMYMYVCVEGEYYVHVCVCGGGVLCTCMCVWRESITVLALIYRTF